MYHFVGLARQRGASVRYRRTYCDGVPFGVDLGHIESNDAAFCEPDCDAGAGAGAAAGCTGAVGGGAGQIFGDCCAACCGGAVGGGAGHATFCCDGEPVGGGVGQFVWIGCCGGAPFAPTSIRVGVDDGGFCAAVRGRPIATLAFGASAGFGDCCAVKLGGGALIASGSASA